MCNVFNELGLQVIYVYLAALNVDQGNVGKLEVQQGRGKQLISRQKIN